MRFSRQEVLYLAAPFDVVRVHFLRPQAQCKQVDLGRMI